MPTSESRPLWEECWEAIRKEVCSVCLDGRGDGECGLPRQRTCYLKARLPQVVAAIEATESGRMDEYYAAVEAQICASCRSREAGGSCPLRYDTECALYTYLPLVVETLADLRARRA